MGKDRRDGGRLGAGVSRVVYVNGAFVPEAEACVSVFDRGFLFADAVYEVTSVLDGRLIDLPAHLARLDRSLREIGLPRPATDAELEELHRRLVRENGLTEGLVYLQVTRGVAERNFLYPPDPRPTLVLFTQALPLVDRPEARAGLRIVTLDDPRWARRDIKTVQLLSASMAKEIAHARGKDDAWFVEDGLVTEGTASNAHLVSRDGTIVTRDLSSAILAGITRAAILAHAAEAGVAVEERPFTVAEAQSAAEAFVTGATAFVLPVVEIDGAPIGDGRPGPTVRRLRARYIEESRRRSV